MAKHIIRFTKFYSPHCAHTIAFCAAGLHEPQFSTQLPANSAETSNEPDSESYPMEKLWAFFTALELVDGVFEVRVFAVQEIAHAETDARRPHRYFPAKRAVCAEVRFP